MPYAIFIALAASCFSLAQTLLRGRRLKRIDREHATRCVAEFDAAVARTEARSVEDQFIAAGWPEGGVRRILERAHELAREKD